MEYPPAGRRLIRSGLEINRPLDSLHGVFQVEPARVPGAFEETLVLHDVTQPERDDFERRHSRDFARNSFSYINREILGVGSRFGCPVLRYPPFEWIALEKPE
jgi:hypothetical protein